MPPPKVVEMMQIADAIRTFPPHDDELSQISSGIARRRTDERTGQIGPACNLSLGKALDADMLDRKSRARSTSWPEAIASSQAEYIAADHFSSSELFACNRAADHTLPNGCAVATHSLGDWTESAEGDPNLLWGRSPHLAEARSGFWKGERASEGRGCFERGTLNADRKANRKGPPCSTAFPPGAGCKSQLRILEVSLRSWREE